MLKMTKNAFTLLEISIVILVIGLLVGAVIVGEGLVKNGRLKGIISEVNEYKTAFKVFDDKFGYLPGDFPKGYTLGCTNALVPNGCNGNGDGQILHGGTGAINTGNESLAAWQHLGLAGLIKANYPGVFLVANEYNPGTNLPETKYVTDVKAGYYFETQSTFEADASISYTLIVLGQYYVGSLNFGPSLSPNDAHAIDLKIDDGLPSSGKMLMNGLHACKTTPVNPLDSVYLVSDTIGCLAGFVMK